MKKFAVFFLLTLICFSLICCSPEQAAENTQSNKTGWVSEEQWRKNFTVPEIGRGYQDNINLYGFDSVTMTMSRLQESNEIGQDVIIRYGEGYRSSDDGIYYTYNTSDGKWYYIKDGNPWTQYTDSTQTQMDPVFDTLEEHGSSRFLAYVLGWRNYLGFKGLDLKNNYNPDFFDESEGAYKFQIRSIGEDIKTVHQMSYGIDDSKMPDLLARIKFNSDGLVESYEIIQPNWVNPRITLNKLQGSWDFLFNEDDVPENLKFYLKLYFSDYNNTEKPADFPAVSPSIKGTEVTEIQWRNNFTVPQISRGFHENVNLYGFDSVTMTISSLNDSYEIARDAVILYGDGYHASDDGIYYTYNTSDGKWYFIKDGNPWTQYTDSTQTGMDPVFDTLEDHGSSRFLAYVLGWRNYLGIKGLDLKENYNQDFFDEAEGAYRFQIRGMGKDTKTVHQLSYGIDDSKMPDLLARIKFNSDGLCESCELIQPNWNNLRITLNKLQGSWDFLFNEDDLPENLSFYLRLDFSDYNNTEKPADFPVFE